MEIAVLRLGHRADRDKRITTHVGLTARAFGADKIILTSSVEESIEKSLTDVSRRWGGNFKVERVDNWRSMIRKWKEGGGKVCHLTMYGENLPDVIDEIRMAVEKHKLMIVVGAEKVPPDVYKLADWNVAVGNQPHSEVAALAVFLDHLHRGKELTRKFDDAEISVIPTREGKKVTVRRKSC